MPRSLRALFLWVDLGFIAYWIVTALHLVPASWAFKDYDHPILSAWNWSFLPLDLAVSATGLASVALARRGDERWRAFALLSLAFTSASGMQAITFWAIRRDVDVACGSRTCFFSFTRCHTSRGWRAGRAARETAGERDSPERPCRTFVTRRCSPLGREPKERSMPIVHSWRARAMSLTMMLASCTPPSSTPATPRPRAIVAAPDRSADDRALDPGRHPAELLAFLDLAPGMRVADLGAGPGYTSELLARAVAPGGTVYMQNDPTWLPFLQQSLEQRFTHAIMQNVVRVERPFVDPLPADARGLDVVVMNLIYHDIVNTPTDRARMNRRIFDALRSGGAYVVIDSSAAAGSGVSANETLHRIDEAIPKKEVAEAGFRLGAEGDFLRNPADTRDWSAQPGPATAAGRRGTSDRFALKFVKQ